MSKCVRRSPKAWRGASVFIITAALIFAGIASSRISINVEAQTSQSPIVISQIYGGGGNSGATFRNDFIELFNRGTTPVNLAGYSLQYTSATGVFGNASNIFVIASGTIQPGGYFLVQAAQGTGGTQNLPAPDAVSTLSLSGTSGKLALARTGEAVSTTTCPAADSAILVDFVAFGSATNCNNQGSTAVLSNTTAAIRKGNGCTDTDNNAADFDVAAPAPRNSSSPVNSCGGTVDPTPTNPSATGAANPAIVEQGGQTLLTVRVTPGTNPISTSIRVTADLTALGGASAQMFFDDGTNGDVTASDNVFSFTISIASDLATGARVIPVNVVDGENRTASTTISLTVQTSSAVVVPINQIQGAGATSPLVGQTVTTIGIVTGFNFNVDNNGNAAGFFIQTADGQTDADANTSEGLFIFTNSAPTVKLGDAVRVRGNVTEFRPANSTGATTTELTNVTITVTSSGNALPTAIALTREILPPTGAPDQSQLERYEGMRVEAANLVANSPSDNRGELWAVFDNPNRIFTTRRMRSSTVRSVKPREFFDAAAPRAMREPGISVKEQLPTGTPANTPRFDENPERILIDLGGTPTTFARSVVATARITSVAGVLDYSFGNYKIVAQTIGQITSVRATPAPLARKDEFTIASFNLENFYSTDANFSVRVQKASKAIREVLRTPDILGVVEVGDLTTLQALAARINQDASAAGQTSPNYTAYLIESDNDTERDIDVGFLVKTNGENVFINVTGVFQEGRDATYTNPVTGGQELLNDRAPLLLTADIAPRNNPNREAPRKYTVIVNHLRSLIDVEIDARVRAKRRAQAEFLANLINARQQADANENIVSVGDYNAFEFNDGYVDVLGTITGRPTPADRVLLPSPDLVNPDLFNLIETLPRSQRYSFVFEGHAQALDHIIVNQAARSRATRFAFARNNADFPDVFETDATRSERVSDHDAPIAYFRLF